MTRNCQKVYKEESQGLFAPLKKGDYGEATNPDKDVYITHETC